MIKSRYPDFLCYFTEGQLNCRKLGSVWARGGGTRDTMSHAVAKPKFVPTVNLPPAADGPEQCTGGMEAVNI